MALGVELLDIKQHEVDLGEEFLDVLVPHATVRVDAGVYLKERILSPKGHQSNVTCGQLLAKNWHPEMRNVFLCHLSHENNDPNVALNTIKDILLDEGIMPGEDVFVAPLERLKASPAYILNNQVIKL